MAAPSRSKDGTSGGSLGHWFRAGGIVLFLLLAFCFAALFPDLWSSAKIASEAVHPPPSALLSLSPETTSAQPGAWLREFLRGQAGSGSPKIIRQKMESPFDLGANRELIAAGGDPFLLAFTAGIDEGRLVLKDRKGGIPVLGPQVPANFSPRLSDREIFSFLQRGVAGPFQSFFADLFGKAHSENGAIQQAESSGEPENPFSQIKQALAESAAADLSETLHEAKVERPPKPAADAPAQKPDASASPAAGAGSSAFLSNLILHVGKDGILQSVPAGRTADGAFESVQMGIQNFDLFSFNDTAEYPAAITVADFNGDGLPDIAYYFSPFGLLRFFYGNAEGTFEEGLRITAGMGPRSMAAGDFNGDGKMDLAISSIGTGLLTILYGDTPDSYNFKSYWLDTYRDYIAAGKSGDLNLVGMNFANQGKVLLDFNSPGTGAAPRSYDFPPALRSQVPTSQGGNAQINAVVIDSSLSLNLTNRQNQLVNVMNIAAGSNAYVVVGDLTNNGSITVGIGRPHP